MIERLRRRMRDQAGFTLVEVLITAALLAVVTTMYLSSLWTIQRGYTRTELRSRGSDAARAAIQQLDREVRSGNLIYDPAAEGPGGNEFYVLRVQTQANGPTRTPPTQCVRWRVLDQKLERQSYQVVGGMASVISGWRTIADGIVNRDVSPAVPAFAMASEGRTVNMVLLANANLASANSQTIRLETTVAIRNSIPGSDPCSPTPAW